MQMSDTCAICLSPMTTVVVFCQEWHLACIFFHEVCLRPALDTDNMTCPICREPVEDIEGVEHRTYNHNLPEYRQWIVECAQRGGDWKQLAISLNVKYKTAYGWVRSGETTNKPVEDTRNVISTKFKCRKSSILLKKTRN